MGNSCHKPLLPYINERFQKQNEKIFTMEQNMKKMDDKYKSMLQLIQLEKKKFLIDELIIQDKITFKGNKKDTILQLNEKDTLQGYPTWF